MLIRLQSANSRSCVRQNAGATSLSTHPHSGECGYAGLRRPGVVLLVVMAMLALFATVALSFVFYAEHEATSLRYVSQAETQAHADADPEMLLSYFLSQLIFDTDNIYSAMRGHSFARNMY